MNVTKVEAEIILDQMERIGCQEGYVVLAFNQPFFFVRKPELKNFHITKTEILNILKKESNVRQNSI